MPIYISRGRITQMPSRGMVANPENREECRFRFWMTSGCRVRLTQREAS